MKKTLLFILIFVVNLSFSQTVDEFVIGLYPIGEEYSGKTLSLATRTNDNFKGQYSEYQLIELKRWNRPYNIDERDLNVKFYIGTREKAPEGKINWHNKYAAIVGLKFTIFANKSGWKSSDFEEYLKKYTNAYGKPNFSSESNPNNMSWTWVGKKQVLELQYLVQNSLDSPQIIIQLSDKKFYTD